MIAMGGEALAWCVGDGRARDNIRKCSEEKAPDGGDDATGSRRAAVLDESIGRGALEGQDAVRGWWLDGRRALAPGGDPRCDRDERRRESSWGVALRRGGSGVLVSTECWWK